MTAKASMTAPSPISVQAIRLDPKYPKAYYNRGIAYDSKGEHDRAIADYGEAIRLEPKDPKAYVQPRHRL